MKVKDAIVVATQYVYIPHSHLKGPGALTSSFAPFERSGRDIEGVFFNWYPPKRLKYVKPRLGESTLT